MVNELLKSPPSDDEIVTILDNQKLDGSFEGIKYRNLSRVAGFPHRQHTYNLVKMGKAFRHKPSRFYQNKALLAQVKLGLAYWVEDDFVGDNWHNNQIITPTNLGNLMLLLGNE